MKKWRDAIVAQTLSLKEAIEVLDRVALQILLVTDASGRLSGTVTDGDLRRAILVGTGLDESITVAMNQHPKSATTEWSKIRLLAMMEENSLLQLPIVDDAGILVDLVTLQGLLATPRQPNPVFLMAGGFGTRLKPLTDACPKPMLKVGTSPILEMIIKSFIERGYHKFFISTHYMAEVVEDYFRDGSDWGADIRYIREDQPLGTAGALSLLPKDAIDTPFFVMNGDVLTDLNPMSLMSSHERLGSDFTVCLRTFDYQIPFGVVEKEGDYLKTMVEKPTRHYEVNAGIYVVNPEHLDRLNSNEYLDMPDFIMTLASEGKKVGTHSVNGTWVDIGRIDDFERAQTIATDLF